MAKAYVYGTGSVGWRRGAGGVRGVSMERASLCGCAHWTGVSGVHGLASLCGYVHWTGVSAVRGAGHVCREQGCEHLVNGSAYGLVAGCVRRCWLDLDVRVWAGSWAGVRVWAGVRMRVGVRVDCRMRCGRGHVYAGERTRMGWYARHQHQHSWSKGPYTPCAYTLHVYPKSPSHAQRAQIA